MKLFFILSILTLSSGHILAQGTIFDIDPSRPFHHGSFTFSHPVFDQDNRITAFSGSYNLNMNFKVSDTYILHLGLPYNYIKYDVDFFDSEHGVGNVKIGLQKIAEAEYEDFSAIQFFVHLPTSDDEAWGVGFFTDFGEFANYLPDVYAFSLQYAAQNASTMKNIWLNYYIGGQLIIPDNEKGNSEVFFRFAMEPVIASFGFNFFLNFRTIAIITEDPGDFSDRFQSTLGFGVSTAKKHFQPSISYRFYLNEPINDLIDGVLIFGFNFNIGE